MTPTPEPTAETPRERNRRREAERQALKDAEHAAWLAGHPDRAPLLALNLASEVFVAEDGYPSLALHTNEEAADLLLSSDWLAAHDAQVAEKAWDEGERWVLRDQGHDVTVYLAHALERHNPYRKEAHDA